MSEWWTYRLSDFLMFSPRTYARLVEAYNASLWPWHVVVLALAVIVLWRASRRVPLLFAVAWAHVGWGFFWMRYSEIFTGATYLAIACGAQAALMLLAHAPARTPWPTIGVVLLYPFASILVLERTWKHAEVFGFMPDATALATLVLALTLQQSAGVRVLWCAMPAAVLVLGWGTLANLHGASG